MKQYEIRRVDAQPDWEQIEAAQIEQQLWLPAVDISMTAKLCYDASNLYVRLQAREAHIRAEHSAPLSQVCEDSCMEFFFSPVADDPRYFNFEINPNGCMYIGFRRSRHERVRLSLPDEDAMLKKNVRRTPDGWVAEYAIPSEFLRLFFPDFALRSGQKMRGNFYKCGDLTEQPHYIAWNPIDHPTPDFHLPAYFAQLLLL